MLFDSKNMQIMQSGLNALSMQQRAILHNLANYETPNYKAKHVLFDDVMKTAAQKGGGARYEVQTRVIEDNTSTVRPDGNNVNADVENMKLYENYVQSLYVYSKISGEINNYRYVLKQGPR